MNLELTADEYQVLWRNDLMSFIERAFVELNPEAQFSPSPHLEVMASTLRRCAEGRIRRLIINLPPRSLKSHSVSVAFVAWLLGQRPEIQIICASYGQDLADKHARDCRTLMQRAFYQRTFPQARLSAEKQSVNEFVTTKQGFRLSTSVGGVLTGQGADLIILDDPLKPEEAMSETKRKSVNEWYDNTLLSRLNNKEKGIIVIVMQRLHQDDLVGHVLEQKGWDVLSFPAIAVEDETHEIEDVFGQRQYCRQEGQVLDPTRESHATLMTMRSSVGEYVFSSQYQQQPIPVGGNIVKLDWIKYYEPHEGPEEFGHILQSWDTANKSGELNDYSVCTTWGIHERKYFYLLDVFRRRLDFPRLKRALRDQYDRYRPDRILIEDKASGTQLIQDMPSEGVYCIEPYLPPSSTDKAMRLFNQTAEFENGRVVLPKNAPWLTEYLVELAAFPGGKHDDQIDATTQALEYAKRILCRLSIYDVL